MDSEILSIVRTFGNRSESWLYRQISELQRYKARVITWKYLNRGEYPYDDIQLLPRQSWIVNTALKLPLLAKGERPPLLDVRERKYLAREANAPSIKLVQAHFGRLGYVCRHIMEQSNKPFIVWFYGSDIFRRKPRKDENIRTLFQSRAYYCCTSQAIKDEMVSLGCPAEKIFVFYPAVEIHEDTTRNSFQNNNFIRILSAGRLIDLKDPLGMVDIARILRDRGVKFEWVHCGDGELKTDMWHKIKEHNLEDNFHILGSVPNSTVLEEMKKADVMVHNATIAPNGSRESFGVVLVEASFLELPIVSARVGGIPEIIVDGRTGCLAEMGDYEGMANKVEMLAGDPALRENFGKAARKHAIQYFSGKNNIKELEKFYDYMSGKNIQLESTEFSGTS